MKQKLFSLLLLLASCESSPRHVKTAAPAKPKPLLETPADYSRALENLPGSPYYYQIHVYNVSLKTVKKAFEQRKDAYSAATFSDGKRLSFSFDMTNPYEQAMQAPIPDYFALQAACFDYGQGSHAANTTYNRMSKAYEMGNSHITTAKGGQLHDVPGAERATTADYQLPFKPHQTRSFKVSLETPFAADCDQITLLGFTRSDQKPGEQVYVGLVIDVASGRIVDQQLRKRNDAFVPSK
ncbi:hypothetical protein E4631_23265 [Hymenobacter sp. UV11]|uniref:hypothetical protein n=1 Tax=Hymenobacter sp. UV11 TaxID=1849735 RepID=UPI001061BD31|nr:hypothetical protein [Hymenobacter sp. UV11]TDN39851.1 hypothetical protein A8B98_16805 [Hymenobacter sp. UV11]TFZ63227.1 hypothetical protein E4631_23265 [Hymenobacter sp. UV11]